IDPAKAAPPDDDVLPSTLADQRKELYRRMAEELELGEARMAKIRAIIDPSPMIGQGNPAVTRHPMTRRECRQRRADAGLGGPQTQAPCAGKNMVPLYDADVGETAKDAKVCIDQFEFPNIACEYPVVYASAREAALLCEAAGKRICDAHEWEGACAGAV